MVSNAGESWLEIEDEIATENENRCYQCFFSLLDACRNFKSWWIETTDNVVLNSPWLLRETGNAFRCVALFFSCATWFYVLFYSTDVYGSMGGFSRGSNLDYVTLIVLFFGFVLNLIAALRRQRESIRATLFYCFLMTFSKFSLGDWVQFRLWEEYRVLFTAVVLCHSNVHPLPLFLVTVFLQIEISIATWFHAVFCSPFPEIFNVMCGSFQLLLVCAFTQDFTDRVRAVSSGEIFRIVDEDPIESPLRGRSARRLCWLMGISSWCAWGAFMIGKAMQEGGPVYNAIFQNRLPICTWLAPCVLIAVLLWARQQRIAWKLDLALLFCCLTPALLVAGDFLLQTLDEACGTPSKPLPVCMDFQTHFGAYMLALCFMALPTLVQAGCHPLLCTLPCILLSVIFVGVEAQTSYAYALYLESEVRAAAVLSWLVWLSHATDYFKRMRAIRQGLERMNENAASSLSLFNNISLSYSRPAIELSVQHSSSRSQPAAQGPQPVSEPSAVDAVAVAVVRHAERADDTHAFDDWGCSQD